MTAKTILVAGATGLDLLHREHRGDVAQFDARDQPLVEGVVGLHVRHHDPEHVIHVAGHAVELQHLRHRRDGGGEALQPLAGMVVGLDRDEHREAEAELHGVEDRHPAVDDAVRLEALDPLPARGLRQADALSDLGDRQRRVVLEQGEDLQVDGVHCAAPILEKIISGMTLGHGTSAPPGN